METLRALINSKQYAEAKILILENRDQIEDIANVLLSVIDELQDDKLAENPWFINTPRSYDNDLFRQEYYGSFEFKKSDEELRQERKQAFEDQSRMTKRPLNDFVNITVDWSNYDITDKNGKSLFEWDLEIQERVYDPIPQEDLKELTKTTYPLPEKPVTWKYMTDGEKGDVVGITLGDSTDDNPKPQPERSREIFNKLYGFRNSDGPK